MITNKDIRVENGSLIINGDQYPLDGQSPEAIMQIVKDNSDTTPIENSDAPITSGGVFTAYNKLDMDIKHPTRLSINENDENGFLIEALKNIKKISNNDNKASMTGIYTWTGHNTYIFFSYRINTTLIYSLVYADDRAYIIGFDVTNEVVLIKKTFTLT